MVRGGGTEKKDFHMARRGSDWLRGLRKADSSG